jgi:hypothetical protein
MKDATPEQLKIFHHRCNMVVVTNLGIGACWILGLAWMIMNNIFNITAAVPAVLISSGIVVYGIQVYFQFLYFRCPACEQPFPPFSRYLPDCCQKCETNYAVPEPQFNFQKTGGLPTRRHAASAFLVLTRCHKRNTFDAWKPSP